MFSGPIGVAIFVFALVAQLVVALIQKIFKDESDDWDKMQIWFNNCLFGTKSSDKGIAYAATFDSMALEINDFMAALINLHAVIQLEKQPIYYLEQMRTYKNSKKDYDQIGHPERAADVAQLCREIYISFILPNYDENQSEYEGMLRFFDRNNQETVALKITKGKKFPILEFINDSPEDLLVKREESLLPADNDTKLIPSKVGKIESYSKVITKDKDEKLGYFNVFYKVGEFCYVGIEEIYLQLNYWPKGQTSQNSQNKIVDNQPLMIYYTYKNHHSPVNGF